MKAGWIVFGLMGVLGGCATQETKVTCEGRLQPINASAATAGGVPKAAPSTVAVKPAAKAAT
jgi:hypothetical protein